MKTKEEAEQYSEKEAAERRDTTIKRMIAMPPKPHSEMKVGKKKTKKTTGRVRKASGRSEKSGS
jgi:hypothetical protein